MLTFQEIPLDQIKISTNYRKTFPDDSLKGLAQSIKENGVIEPIIVRPNGKGFVVIAGDRRFKACKIAGLPTIPAIIRDISDADALKVQLIENVQRENVPYMEEAYGLQQLRDDHALDVAELCKILGKSDAWVYQGLQLARMAGDARRIAEAGWLSKSVALVLSRLPNEEDQNKAANELARTNKSKLVDLRFVRKYLEVNFSGKTGKYQPRRNAIQKANGNDFAANWKKYLVNFESVQFEYWKSIVRGRTDVATLSEAVERVMMRG